LTIFATQGFEVFVQQSQYVDLCDRGGSASFRELVRSANLVSPFEPGALTQVVEKVRQTLKTS
jgi:hypothetical protein